LAHPVPLIAVGALLLLWSLLSLLTEYTPASIQVRVVCVRPTSTLYWCNRLMGRAFSSNTPKSWDF
jgi:hypothetical protein